MSDSSDSFRNKTLQVYKNDYPELLNYYRSLNEDNDETTFVNSEIRLVNDYIEPVVKNETTDVEKECGYDLSIEMIKQRLSSYLKIIEFLETKKTKLETDIKTEAPRHEHIFCNNGFELFEDILSEYVKPIGKKGRLSDIHYYYWKMYEDDFIHQRPERFKTWFFEIYEKEDLGKIKTLKEVENLDRNIHYETALGWFKQQHR
jgi:hypothetical protein